MIQRLLFLCVLLAAFVPGVALAKRTAPPKVEPVITDGVRYAAPNDDGQRARVQAWDVKTGKLLWEVTVFRATINPALEADVQHVYITKLRLRDGKLIVAAEDGREFSVDPKTRAVTKLPPARPSK